MQVPERARAEFDACVVAPLLATAVHKRDLASLPGDRAVIDGTLRLLDTIERKTSPLYVRLILYR